MSRIDDAVTRILWVKSKLGLFDKPIVDFNYYKKFGSEEFSQINYNAAVESITLLKNTDQLLPLKKKGQRILVTGVAANSITPLNGAWTHTWQGKESKYNPENKKTIFQAIKDKVGAENALWVEGADYEKDINISKAVDAAQNVDVVVVCLGEKSATEKPGDIDDLTLDKVQLELVKKIAVTGKPIVLVLSEARPRIITEVEPLVKGLVLAYLSGNEGGRAIADILYGDVNPSGKLPFTYPKYTGSLTTYDYKNSETRDPKFGNNAIQPLFPFGFGLSYTQFAYANLTVSNSKFLKGDSISIGVDVKNIGSVSGKEVVQLYIRDEYASITPSNKRLRGFKKVSLPPGKTEHVTFKIVSQDLAFVDAENKWVVESGDFKILIEQLSVPFALLDVQQGIK
jgi:beta-glucosidase